MAVIHFVLVHVTIHVGERVEACVVKAVPCPVLVPAVILVQGLRKGLAEIVVIHVLGHVKVDVLEVARMAVLLVRENVLELVKAVVRPSASHHAVHHAKMDVAVCINLPLTFNEGTFKFMAVRCFKEHHFYSNKRLSVGL